MPERVCIVTAATGAIASAIVRQLASEGWKLALMARTDGAAEKLAGEIGGIGMKGTITSDQDLQTLFRSTMDKWGRVDGVVNSSGRAPHGGVTQMTDAQWQEGFDLLFLSVVRMARLVTPIMERQKGGALVNISTFTAYEPSLRFPNSSVVRAGLGAYAKLYSSEFGPAGIRMNNILPGMMENYAAAQEWASKIPLRRLGLMTEI
ncbi:MAG: SDR family oxidoreductase, partial [Pseudorhodoplanes sp.]